MSHTLAHTALRLKQFKKLLFAICILSFILGSCTTPAPVEKKEPQLVVKATPQYLPILKSSPSEADYLRHGISLIAGMSGDIPDYERAQSVFEALIKDYPNSKWKDSTTALIKLINNLKSCIEREKTAYTLYEKNLEEKKSLFKEYEQLRKSNNMLQEKLQAEISKLLQENEKLKKDIELLKDLEIKLDKRERLLK